ncbi:hypothetical protein LSTR_LSTR017062 [Laodelphax striatellus]|uniref:Uncharacterized protein n=1 Tax=Laodelphax striatellus TaxID=195883 RepID=A0A482WFN4_LAOST|nr:hypothetical protein LSTR_LSTR017062 [Laodelphax striatellus]
MAAGPKSPLDTRLALDPSMDHWTQDVRWTQDGHWTPRMATGPKGERSDPRWGGLDPRCVADRKMVAATQDERITQNGSLNQDAAVTKMAACNHR